MKSKVLHVEYCARAVWFPLSSNGDDFFGIYTGRNRRVFKLEDWPVDDPSVKMNFPIQNILEEIFK